MYQYFCQICIIITDDNKLSVLAHVSTTAPHHEDTKSEKSLHPRELQRKKSCGDGKLSVHADPSGTVLCHNDIQGEESLHLKELQKQKLCGK